MDLHTLSGTNFNVFIGSIFNNSVLLPICINIFAFIGLIFGVINYKRMSKYMKQIFWISVFMLIVSSCFFPWNILSNTFIKILQFTWRLYIIPQLLLTYIFADNVISLCKNKKQSLTILPIISLCIMCAQITGQREITNHYNVKFNSEDVINDNNIFEKDYRPTNSDPVTNIIARHEGIYEKNHHVIVNRLENGKFSFKLYKNIDSFNLPFVIFNGIDYQIKVDGNNSKWHIDNYFRLTINHLIKGKHTVQVIVHKSWYDYLSYVLSTIGVIIFTFAWIGSLILKYKNKT